MDASDFQSPSSSNSSAAVNQTLSVVCAWSVSGQYGPGSRVLYYVLVAACVFARKSKWTRNACLAAALLFAAVSGLHAIVLAAVHVQGAVDMDVYGAFQFCAIGILAAPVTLRHSRTYFFVPGRNSIFLWLLVILGGLLSLTVEFYRYDSIVCSHDGDGNLLNRTSRVGQFQSCSQPQHVVCSNPNGPLYFSPLRRSSGEIHLIPAPERLTFGTATLLAATCCIPAVLSMVSMWNKILEVNWKSRFGTNEDQVNVPISGTNGATVDKMRRVNAVIGRFLSVIEIPLFGAAVVGIIIYGELNFFSPQVDYQTEPMTSIGQWAPIVGTTLAVIGSLAKTDDDESNMPLQHCLCSRHGPNIGHERASMHSGRDTPGSRRLPSARGLMQSSMFPNDLMPYTTEGSARRSTVSNGGRHAIAEVLNNIGDYLGSAAPDLFDDHDFKHGKAVDFPEIPGEGPRNPALTQIREQYNIPRDEDRQARSSISPSPSSRPSISQPRTGMTDLERQSVERQGLPKKPRPPRSRGDTLEVPKWPSPVHSRSSSATQPHTCPSSSVPVTAAPSDGESPTILMSLQASDA